MPPSSISQEPILNFNSLSHLRLSIDSALAAPFFPTLSSSSISLLHNSLYFNGFLSSFYPQRRNRKPVFTCGLSISSSKLQFLWNEYNRFLQFHCGMPPLGFASLGLFPNEANSTEDGNGVLEEGLPVNVVGVEAPKKVLILMSDTGGGHRASAEAIKAAFNREFGHDYQVFVTDLWTDHTPWPFNQLPRSYNFLVKHGTLWKMTYYGSVPRLVHQSNFAATSTFIAREVAKGLMKYQPDIIISVHPLMQHVPLRVLRAKGFISW